MTARLTCPAVHTHLWVKVGSSKQQKGCFPRVDWVLSLVSVVNNRDHAATFHRW